MREQTLVCRRNLWEVRIEGSLNEHWPRSPGENVKGVHWGRGDPALWHFRAHHTAFTWRVLLSLALTLGGGGEWGDQFKGCEEIEPSPESEGPVTSVRRSRASGATGALVGPCWPCSRLDLSTFQVLSFPAALPSPPLCAHPSLPPS